MIFVLLVCALSWSVSAAEVTFTDSCPLVNPPLTLGTGALDQLVDTLLRQLLTRQSTVVVETPLYLPQNIDVSDIRITRLDKITRKCPIQLSSSDSLGCSQRGLTLKACFGADGLRIELTVKTKIVGFKQSRYLITLPKATTNVTVALFSPGQMDSVSNTDKRKQAVRIVEMKTTIAGNIHMHAVEGNFFQRMISSALPFLVDLFSGPLLKGLDSYMMNMLNEKLSHFSLDPLFIPQSTSTLLHQHHQHQQQENPKENQEGGGRSRRRFPDQPLTAIRDSGKLRKYSVL